MLPFSCKFTAAPQRQRSIAWDAVRNGALYTSRLMRNVTNQLDGPDQQRTAEAGDPRIVEPGDDTALEQGLVVAGMFKAEAHARHGPR